MNRRELLQTLATSSVVPQVSGSQDDGDDEERRLTYRQDDYAAETGRIVERYEIEWREHTRAQWLIKTTDGELLFREEYPLAKISEHYYGDTFIFRIYESKLLEDIVGATMFSPRNKSAYHKHVTDDRVVTYRQNILTDEYERI